jgi:hypothetical protein
MAMILPWRSASAPRKAADNDGALAPRPMDS